MSPKHFIPEDFVSICQRIREKSESYMQYNFSRDHSDFLKTFFDLSQECTLLEDFYRICVAVPLELAEICCNLYVCEETCGSLELVCAYNKGVLSSPEKAEYPIRLADTPYVEEDWYVMPIYSKQLFTHETNETERPRQPRFLTELKGPCAKEYMLGMFAVQDEEGKLNGFDRFFLGKYVNRIGYNLASRLIARQNIERLKFINTLVMDIEHNVIVPNMYFRYLFKQLDKKINTLDTLQQCMLNAFEEKDSIKPCHECVNQLREVENELRRDYQEIVKHHAHMTLFIESLFRKEHFEQGHLVLRPKRCLLEKEVIIPQLEHYALRLEAAKITVDKAYNMDKEEFPIMVDIGLLAQVYANLFSNAVKYTREIIDHRGLPRKAMAYGRERIDDFLRKGQQGIKFNVFTTGPSLNKGDAARLFTDGIRGEKDEDLPGTGHGLSFVRHVVEMHGGKVGHEATAEGNNFYFILPLPPFDLPELSDFSSTSSDS